VPSAPPGRAERAAGPIAEVLALQRMAGNAAVGALLSRAVLQRQVGWTGVDPGSWNAKPRDVKGAKGVKRIPIEGITRGHASGAVKGKPDTPRQDDAAESVDEPETGDFKSVSTLTPEAAGGVKTGRAVVLIPNGLPAKGDSVEVLFHLHGYTPGGRGRGKDGTGDPEDVAVARIAQQLEASGRPMIAILPQGTRGAGFFPDSTKVELNKYIDEALDLVPADLWPGGRKRSPGRVVLSAHSGGGDVLAWMMKASRVPGTDAGDRAVEGLFLFDAMHGWGPGQVATFLKAHMDEELAQLHEIWTAKNASAKPEQIADEQTEWLRKSGFRFRGFAGDLYFKRYDTQLRPALADWFDKHAAQLGGKDSRVFRMLSSNYLDTAAAPSGTSHERILGGTLTGTTREHEHLVESLGALQGSAGPDLKAFGRVPAQPPPKPARGKRALSRDTPTAGWAGAAKGSTNAAPRTTTGTNIKRVPVKNIATGRGDGNALVLIPDWLPKVGTVEVLFHLHGHRTETFQEGYKNAEDETLYRFEQALDQFSADKKRPIIAILPQGGPVSEFGHDASDLNANTYIQQAIAAVPPDQWPGGTVPQAQGVILSGHSGAGGRFASMFGTAKMPAKLESFFSFDTINGKDGQKVSEIPEGNEFKQHVKFLLGRLDDDLAMLKAERAKASNQTDEQIQDALAAKLLSGGFRFRGYYSGTPSLKDAKTLNPAATADYADRYFLLAAKIDKWFEDHASELGGKGSKVYDALRANYTIQASGTDHMHDMGGIKGPKDTFTHENMRAALGSLPTTPQGGP
jgi:hypothetical protein